jgi:broad specificity phosphatase PhoE/predicted kinase
MSTIILVPFEYKKEKMSEQQGARHLITFGVIPLLTVASVWAYDVYRRQNISNHRRGVNLYGSVEEEENEEESPRGLRRTASSFFLDDESEDGDPRGRESALPGAAAFKQTNPGFKARPLNDNQQMTGGPWTSLGLEQPLVVAMVGLPARGKSYIVKMIIRFLTWTGFECKVFNVGSYRRDMGLAGADSSFFSTENKESGKVREEMAMVVQSLMYEWLHENTARNRVAFFDATNTTEERRAALATRAKQEACFLLFVESICDDEEVLQRNYELKLQNDDYKHMAPARARADFQERVSMYEKVYVFCYTMFFLPSFLVHDGLFVSYPSSITACLHSVTPHDTSLTIIIPSLPPSLPPSLNQSTQCSHYLLPHRYETVQDAEHGGTLSYIKMINVGQKMITRNCTGYLPCQISFFLQNVHIHPRKIYLSLTSMDAANAELFMQQQESTYSAIPLFYCSSFFSFLFSSCVCLSYHLPAFSDTTWHESNHHPPSLNQPSINRHNTHITSYNNSGTGRSSQRLTVEGKQYSQDLARFLEEQRELHSECKEMLVLSGASRVHAETLFHLRMVFSCYSTPLLNEMRGGDLHGLTRVDIERRFPQEHKAREKNKLRYRFPGVGGESYLDIIERIRPVIVEIERQRRSVLTVCHIAVLRCIYAYLVGSKLEDIPHLEIKPHHVYELSPGPFGCTVIDHDLTNR